MDKNQASELSGAVIGACLIFIGLILASFFWPIETGSAKLVFLGLILGHDLQKLVQLRRGMTRSEKLLRLIFFVGGFILFIGILGDLFTR